MQPVNDQLLQQTLTNLAQTRPWRDGLLAKLAQFIHTADEEALFRINPLRFALQNEITENEAIDLFLFATQIGLFHMDWILFCGSCGCIVETLQALSTVHSHYKCQVCASETTANLDDYIAIYFTISPKICPIPFHTPAALSAEVFYFRYKYSGDTFFQGGVIAEVPETMPSREFFNHRAKLFATLSPQESLIFETDVQSGFLALDEAATNSQTIFFISHEPAASEQIFHLTIGEALPPFQIGAGKVRLHVTNGTSQPAQLFVINLPLAIFELGKVGVILNNVLLSHRILTSATFKELFRHEVIATNEGMGISNITLLFTDLKGSTELYDKIGDLKAFALVREHFEHLSKMIAQNSGVIVKTIGDAVMAAFITPLDGLRSARQILTAIADLNHRLGSNDIILKIGLHSGQAIVVTLNDRIDYFGQTVNIAARVQAVAEANEICFTDTIYHAPGVSEVLANVEITTEQAKLKGIAEKITIYKITG